MFVNSVIYHFVCTEHCVAARKREKERVKQEREYNMWRQYKKTLN